MAGNQVRAQSTVTFTNATTSKAYDVVFTSSQMDSKFLNPGTISPGAAALPNLRGFGDVKDLAVAMTSDATLLTQVTTFKNMAANDNWPYGVDLSLLRIAA